MRIVILAPSDKSFIKRFLNENFEELPDGYRGAPFIGTLIEELLSKNHEVIAITTTVAIDDKYEIKEFCNNNFKWVVIPARPHSIRLNNKKLGRILDLFAYEQKQMLKAVLQYKPDFVHAHWSYEFAGVAVKSGFPFLVTIHDNPYKILRYFKNVYRLGRLIMSELILKKVHFASTVSPYMLPYAKRKCPTIKVISNPIKIYKSLEQIENLIIIRKEALSSPKIIMINNGWDMHKNGKKGLLAFQELQRILPDASLHLFGNGSEKEGLAYNDAKVLGLQNVYFHGSVDHESLVKEIQTHHLLLHPSLEESFGLVLIEAMSNGVPAIGGSYSGAVPWVLNSEQLLVDVNSVDAMKNKMVEILTNEELYKQVSINGYLNVKNRFSSTAVVDHYLSYYKEIIEASM